MSERCRRFLADPEAHEQARAEHADAVKNAIQIVMANDPTRWKSKETADQRIANFADWLNSFKPTELEKLSTKSMEKLRKVLALVVAMLEGLQGVKPEDCREHD